VKELESTITELQGVIACRQSDLSNAIAQAPILQNSPFRPKAFPTNF
jgi:hypothetical protein